MSTTTPIDQAERLRTLVAEGPHTPLPWTYAKLPGTGPLMLQVRGPDGGEVCLLEASARAPRRDRELEANAGLIVAGCNHHLKLIERLGELCEEWERQKRLFPVVEQDGWMDLKVAAARKVLEEAKGARR